MLLAPVIAACNPEVFPAPEKIVTVPLALVLRAFSVTLPPLRVPFDLDVPAAKMAEFDTLKIVEVC